MARMKLTFLSWASILLLSGCAALEAPVRHTADLSACKTFHVSTEGGDPLGFAPLLVAEMEAMDLKCTHGGGAAPKEADALLTFRYEPLPGRADRASKLVVQAVDVRSGKVLATSRSDQEASLFPSPNAEMARLAIRNLMAATPGPKGHPRGSLMERETLLW